MGKLVADGGVILPFGQSNPQFGRRRPALLV
jgi:hypothetical protein